MKYKEVLEFRKKADINQVPQGLQDYQLGRYMAQPSVMPQQTVTQGGFGFGSFLPMLMMGGLAAFGGQKQQVNKVPAANSVNKAPTAQNTSVNTQTNNGIWQRIKNTYNNFQTQLNNIQDPIETNAINEINKTNLKSIKDRNTLQAQMNRVKQIGQKWNNIASYIPGF